MHGLELWVLLGVSILSLCLGAAILILADNWENHLELAHPRGKGNTLPAKILWAAGVTVFILSFLMAVGTMERLGFKAHPGERVGSPIIVPVPYPGLPSR